MLAALAACSTSPTAWSKPAWLACWRRRWAGVAGGPSSASKSSLSMPDMAVACHPHHRPAAPPDEDPRCRPPPMPTASVPHRPDRRPVVSARPAAARPALWPWPARPPRHQPPCAGERDLVRALDRLPMAGPARRLSPLTHRPPPLRRWAADGTLAQLHAVLRGRVCAAAGRAVTPTAAVIDSQSVPASDWVSRATKGYDAAKQVHGRKRHVAVDTGGLIKGLTIAAVAPRQPSASHGC